MTKQELLEALRRIREGQADGTAEGDFEDHHVAADNLLLRFIDDEAVTAAFRSIEKWYA